MIESQTGSIPSQKHQTHLIVILNTHAECIDEYSKKYSLLKELVINELFRPTTKATRRAHATVSTWLQYPSCFRAFPSHPTSIRRFCRLVFFRPLLFVLHHVATARTGIGFCGCEPLGSIFDRDVSLGYTFNVDRKGFLTGFQYFD